MDTDKLKRELEADEGCVYSVYLDHLDLPTFGIGHLIRKNDPEYGLEVGAAVSSERVLEAFEEDIQVVLDDCENLYQDFGDLPEEAQLTRRYVTLVYLCHIPLPILIKPHPTPIDPPIECPKQQLLIIKHFPI